MFGDASSNLATSTTIKFGLGPKNVDLFFGLRLAKPYALAGLAPKFV